MSQSDNECKMREDICRVMNSIRADYIRLYVSLMAHRIIFIKTGFIPLQENTQSFYLIIFANEATYYGTWFEP